MRPAVILVTFDSGGHVAACLASLGSAAAQVIVVDNASADDTVARVRTCAPDAQVIVNRVNRGYGAALNQGVAATDAELVVLANPDLTFGEGALERMAMYMEGAPRCGLAGPRGSGRGWPGVGLEACELFLGHRVWPGNPVHGRFFEPAAPAWLVGACLMARRAALLEVGGFDEDYALYFEEVDLAWRLARAGWERACVAEAEVHHAGGGSSAGQGVALEDVYRASQRRFFRKAFGEPAADALRVVQVAGNAFRVAWWGARGMAPARDRARRALSWFWKSRKIETERLLRGAP